MMIRLFLFALFFLCICLDDAGAFVAVAPIGLSFAQPSLLVAKSKKPEAGEQADSVAPQQQALPIGTFVEFVEKSRSHVGKVDTVEHKSNGGARYRVLDSEGKKYDISDKEVKYAMPCPNSPSQANKLYDEFCRAQEFPIVTLQEELDVTADLLEMAWEETAALAGDFDDGDSEQQQQQSQDASATITPASFVELVHAHAASAMEKYLAWKLLQSETSHIFFKELKDHGRVVAFKAKSRKAVQAAKETFCRTHEDDELCYV